MADVRSRARVKIRYEREGGNELYQDAVDSWADVLTNALDRDHWIEQAQENPAQRVFIRNSEISGTERLELDWSNGAG